MKLRRLIKENASRALRFHWCRATSIALIALIFCSIFVSLEGLLSAVFGLPAFVDPFATPELHIDDIPNVSPVAMAIMGIISVLYFAVLSPLAMGIMRWFFFIGDGRAESTITIFEFFFTPSQFWKAIWLRMSLFFRRLLWSVVFLAVPVTLIYLADMWRHKGATDIESVLSLGFMFAGCVLFVLLGVFLLIWFMRYYLAEYMLISDSELSVSEAISQSARISRGRCAELLMLELSMVGWRIVDLLIIPRLFTMPYRFTVKGLYAHYLLELSKRDQAAAQSE